MASGALTTPELFTITASLMQEIDPELLSPELVAKIPVAAMAFTMLLVCSFYVIPHILH
jgi:hypothetical protein